MQSFDIFVIMPFLDQFHLVYNHLIKAPLEAKGHRVSRSLEANQQNGLRAIIQGLERADVIVADLTGQNANVTYGAWGSPTRSGNLLFRLRKALTTFRYDLQAYNVILYSIESDGSSRLGDDIPRLHRTRSG